MDYRHIHFAGAPRAPRAGKAASLRPAGAARPEPPLDPLLRLILRSAGVNPADYRATAMHRRLPVCLRLLKAANSQDGAARLAENPALLPKLVNALLLGVSEFRRDQTVFESLADHVVPDLLSRPAKPRIWSAACSEGQELYSVAVLLSLHNGLGGAELLGTDCRPGAISFAQQGCYPAAAVEALPSHWQTCFHRRSSGDYQVTDELRRSVRWQGSDLLQEMPAGTWDLVLCRNVVIYLTMAAAEGLWHRLVQGLNPGGYLITGKAERPPAKLGLRRIDACIYQKSPLVAPDPLKNVRKATEVV